jgi:hypothetical protein
VYIYLLLVIFHLSCCGDLRHELGKLFTKSINVIVVNLEEKESFCLLRKTGPVKDKYDRRGSAIWWQYKMSPWTLFRSNGEAIFERFEMVLTIKAVRLTRRATNRCCEEAE